MERTVEQLKERIRAGGAKLPAEKVIRNGQLVNVMTSEIYPAEIAIYKDMIAAVGDETEIADYIGPDTEIIDAKGRYLAPGMIDGHIHSECSKLSITSYSKAVVPHGTTSMISGLDEYISVSNLEGLQEIFAEVKKSPLKVFWGAPYKTPYTVPESTVSFNFTKEVHQTVQKWPECFGVWETVTEFVQEEDENTLGAISEAGKNNLPVFGCAPMATGKKLNAYLCSGVRLDHESYDHVEVVEKMRKGMHMLIRESCVTHFLAENIRAVTEVNPYLARRVSFCTDDVTATDILEKGHMDNLVRLAIKAGVEPMTAIQMATINSAEAYRIDHLVGSICPGRTADILFVEDLQDFKVDEVMTSGSMVAKDYKLTYDLKAPARSPIFKGELKCVKTTADDFSYHVPIRNGEAKVLSMDVKGPFVRKRRDVVLQVKDGVVQPDTEQDAIMISVLERFGRNGNKSLAFCSGWELKKGAMASTNAPDDNNLIVMGANAEDMSFAANYLIPNPVNSLQYMIDGFAVIVPYLAVIIPVEIYNFIETMDNVEGANAAGDSYNVRQAQFADGIFTMISACFGGVVPNTVWLGHVSLKRTGAGIGYSVIAGIILLLAGILGMFTVLSDIIPKAIVAITFLWCAVDMLSQAFGVVEKKYYAAIGVAMVPSVADFLYTQITRCGRSCGPLDGDSSVRHQQLHS